VAVTSDGAGLGTWETIEDQLALRPLIREYVIPVEANVVWYALGGVLMIALLLEMVTGFLLIFQYVPDASIAYDITRSLIQAPVWHVIINFHFFNAFLIFALILIHMMRVFISGGYRRGKQGTWLVGVVLAGLAFLLSLTGETLHWDEVGFAVPWHVSETLQLVHLDDNFSYTFDDLKTIPIASQKLSQFYGIHIALAVALVAVIVWHFLLIRIKGISLPFWLTASGRRAPFSEHVQAWLRYSAIILGVVVLAAIFVPRDPGIAPQLVPESPFYGMEGGPGHLGAKPTYPISWTHGMNVFFGEHLGIEPDIWGTIVGLALMTLALVVIPFVDVLPHEPVTAAEAFSWSQRHWAFLAIGVFWLVMIVGIVQNYVAGAG
jgi:quinol-cytochrome oxidoreductase complex cytochrome b subunit